MAQDSFETQQEILFVLRLRKDCSATEAELILHIMLAHDLKRTAAKKSLNGMIRDKRLRRKGKVICLPA